MIFFSSLFLHDMTITERLVNLSQLVDIWQQWQKDPFCVNLDDINEIIACHPPLNNLSEMTTLQHDKLLLILKFASKLHELQEALLQEKRSRFKELQQFMLQQQIAMEAFIHQMNIEESQLEFTPHKSPKQLEEFLEARRLKYVNFFERREHLINKENKSFKDFCQDKDEILQILHGLHKDLARFIYIYDHEAIKQSLIILQTL